MANILIIDDEPGLRALVRDILEPDGHSIIEAADGINGVRQFKQAQFDLVLTDIIMPNQEGIETIGEILRLRPDQKIIVISGGGRTKNLEYLKIAKTLGAKEALAKPFTPSDLRRVVKACLG